MGFNDNAYYRELYEEQLADPKWQAFLEYRDPKFIASAALLDARKRADMSQEELSKASGVRVYDIRTIEESERSSSILILWRLARGLNMRLKVEFVPYDEPTTPSR